MQSAISGQASGEPLGVGDFIGDMSGVDDQIARTARRERAFLDAFRCLMRLWAVDGKRNGAERVFELLAAIRLIDSDHEDSTFAEEIAPNLPQTPEEASPQDRRKAFMGSFLDLQERTAGAIGRRQEGWNQKIAESDRLLGEALALAKELAR